jgi:predicted metalloprotease
VFLDTDFFGVLSQQMGARGDFAAAYVIAHDVAHHVQNELGLLGEVNRQRQMVGERESNQLSVRTELQADCYSGLWARHAAERYGTISDADIQDALNAAARIGDDALQRASRGVVVPDSFTHGSSEQRQRWFHAGYSTGDPQACDTFGTDAL